MRVVTLDSWRKARVVVADGAWRGSGNRFLDWTAGETIVVLVAREGIVTASVAGWRSKPALTEQTIGVCDWRVPLERAALVQGVAGQRLNAGIRDVLRHCYGESVYFRVLLHGVRLGDEPESRVRSLLGSPKGAQQPDSAGGGPSDSEPSDDA